VLTTDDARLLLDEINAVGGPRSAVYSAIESFEGTTRDEQALQDAAWIRHWYDTVYLRAQAFQHGADFRGVPSVGFAVVGGRLEAESRIADRVVEVTLPPAACMYLAAAPDENWIRLISDRGGHLEAWWSSGNADSLRRFLELMHRSAEDYGLLPQPQRRVLAHVPTLGARLAIGAAQLPLGFDWSGVATLAVIVTAQWARSLVASPVRVEVTDYGERSGLQQAG